MKKVNIQRDLISRSEISGKPESTLIEEVKVEPVTLQENAQSETIPQSEIDESTGTEEKPAKRGRKTKGDV